MDVFIFTTRYLGISENCCFPDEARKYLDVDSAICKYKFSKLEDDAKVVFELLWKLYNSHDGLKQQLSQIDYHYLDNKRGWDSFKLDAQKDNFRKCMLKWLYSMDNTDDFCRAALKFFSYYEIGNNLQDNCRVVAVHHLDWIPDDLSWVKSVIDGFSSHLKAEDHLYLILHDKDWKGETQPFSLLKDKEKGGLCKNLKFKVDVILFQHTSNYIVDTLKKKFTANEISQRIKNLIIHKDNVVKALDRNTIKEDRDALLKGFPSELALDFVNIPIDVKQITKREDIYVYEDRNGALLVELMHNVVGVDVANQFVNLIKELRKPAVEGSGRIKDIKRMQFPLIVKIYKSVFENWAMVKGDNKIREHANKIAIDENLKRVFSLFNNSSIWVRLVDVDDVKAFKSAVAEFQYFKSIGLYDYDSAWERLEYNTRVFVENYLSTSVGGHGSFITPILYGNESEFRRITSTFDNIKKQSFSDVAMRILVIDDKVGMKPCGANNEVSNGACNKDCENKKCKLRVLSLLLEKSMPVKKEDGDATTGTELHDFFHWNNKEVEMYYHPLVSEPNKLNDKKYAEFIGNTAKGHVQIVGVRDVCTALLLLSKYKFDMVFCDYLLDYKRGGESTESREYATRLMDFLSADYENDKKWVDIRNNVLYNRGPLDKLWIMPITGYNQSFIQDLCHNRTNLIDYKWNISHGADPITTPWQFLYHFNEFIELQLKSCVYRMDHLLRFVKLNCEGIIKLSCQRGGELGFIGFQSFMGAEYANFMRRYGNRHLVQRDAVTDRNDKSLVDKSVFATYIWNHFYANTEYRDEIELNRLIQRFLRHASVVHNDRSGQQRLEETFGQLCFFIDTNEKVIKIIKEDNVYNLREFDFHGKMLKLKEIMDDITSHSKKKQQNGNKQR